MKLGKFRSTAGKKVKNRAFLERIGNVGMRQTIPLLRLCLRKLVTPKHVWMVGLRAFAHLFLAFLASGGGTSGIDLIATRWLLREKRGFPSKKDCLEHELEAG